ncbi:MULTISPECIES: multicopper oxidase domain-containing protein [unclassified Mesorhizobium]|uniref:multicopper oxidase domain-containing protein n=1 Tax=unclassified Mesorhizobium TaxID=325217 RepID=UPI00247805D0|nr:MULTISPECIES: multicopper oxidase domain-containing protein [unclassified Mesorhizobium]
MNVSPRCALIPGRRLEAAGPGKWLVHCHIAHHTTNNHVEEKGGGGLMVLIDVSRRGPELPASVGRAADCLT